MDLAVTQAPDVVSQLAERCVSHVLHRCSVELDYHQDTLGVVDFFVAAVIAEEGEGASLPPGHHRRVHLIHLLAPAVGSYFGETLRRIFPCRWRIDGSDPGNWALEFDEVLLRFNPVGAAAEAFAAERIDGWGGSLATVPEESALLAERLSLSPPVPEDDFYSLTTRLEVVQIAVDWLHCRRSQNGEDQTLVFSMEDYDRLLGDPGA
jgi:hypothetical protein